MERFAVHARLPEVIRKPASGRNQADQERPMATSKWSQDVTRSSNALDLESDVFTRSDPKSIAASLKKSAEASHRRRATPLRSAMSMLTFYINRAGKDLDPGQKRVLESAKQELRKAFGKPEKV
ncbi:DUF3175 domain-containing protein [Novosphingobium sp. JCM 18896]|uniref:DUF3175 domain-containing protein n=1 Tax=Novosphingobium sp. JCM 18896 TaxID=2989731 RepID=UPI00222276B6|nr:DUF3175 domain-containing protein [Novosphingobium sp. JCM 18896]MCW1430352.1 DUF3175 domain-containing protein [Novosphingobium sp. JCM 18896]